jgi:hypothetical protein
MGELMKKIVVALGVLLLAAGGWYYASPLWTLRAMKDAAVSRDSEALSRYVDYEALRTDLKGDMRRSMMSEMGKQPDNPFGAIGMAIAMNLIDPMIEAMVTPEGDEVMFAQQRAAESNETTVAGAAGSGRTPTKGLAAAGPGDDPVIERVGIDEFRVHDKGKDGGLIFRRHGLGWKLSGVDIPNL